MNNNADSPIFSVFPRSQNQRTARGPYKFIILYIFWNEQLYFFCLANGSSKTDIKKDDSVQVSPKSNPSIIGAKLGCILPYFSLF